MVLNILAGLVTIGIISLAVIGLINIKLVANITFRIIVVVAIVGLLLVIALIFFRLPR